MKKQNLFRSLTGCMVCISVLSTSCKKENNDNPEVTADVLITCEGVFGSGTGSISKFNINTKNIQNNAFETANGYPLGNVVQSVSVFNDRAYIVVNNSGKVEVATAATLTSVGQINGLINPRNFLGIDDHKGYITEWGSTQGQIMVVDLQTLMITDSIPCGSGTEFMLKKGDYIYVSNSGGFSNDNTVTVINPETDAVVTTITVGPNPTGLVTDSDGKIWALCNGVFLNQDGSLVRISTSTQTVDMTIPIQQDSYQARLAINNEKNKLFFSIGDKTFSHSITSSTFNTNPWQQRGFYSIAIDPHNNILYGSDARDYISNGWVLRFDVNSGAVIDSFETGIIPGNFFFN